MKRKLVVAMIAASLALSGCGHPQSLTVQTNEGKSITKEYPTYGIFNEHDSKSQYVCYKVNIMSAVVAAFFLPSVFIPLYVLGFDLWEPVRAKKSPTDSCGLD